jgi:hypothetical protein
MAASIFEPEAVVKSILTFFHEINNYIDIK